MKRLMLLVTMVLCQLMPAEAVDSYRYMHVGVETTWGIFIFIFALVIVPIVLAVILHWYTAMKKDEDSDDS